MKEFKNKTALITGAAHGIGFELAKECARREMNVVMCDIDENALDIASDEIKKMGVKVLTSICDVTEIGQVKELHKKIKDTFGITHVLFNNAGVTALGDIVSMPVRDWDYCIKTNLYGPYYFMKTFLPDMMDTKEECYIVNVASRAGIQAGWGMPAYYASKHALVGVSESLGTTFLALNMNIRMTIVCPGMVKTDLNNCDDRRPEKFAVNLNEEYYTSELYKSGRKTTNYDISTGVEPSEVVKLTFESMEKELLYCPIFDSSERDLRKRLLNRANVYIGKEKLDLSPIIEFNKRFENIK